MNNSKHDQYWTNFWEKSYIQIPNDRKFSQLLTAQRYIQNIQGRYFPIKFNGMFLTANRPPNTDYRQWGGMDWWQNERHPYYNMLTFGDVDLLDAFISRYSRNVEFAKLRTKYYFPDRFSNASFYFNEINHPMFSVGGLVKCYTGNCNRSSDLPIGYSMDPWDHYNWQGGLDLSLMIFDEYAYTQNKTKFLSHLPVIIGTVEYYSKLWLNRDINDKIYMFPTQSLETWQCPNYPPSLSECVVGDTPTISGLMSVIPRLLALPDNIVSASKKREYKKFLDAVPSIPIQSISNVTVIWPCIICPPCTSNVENTELYTVHPYRLYTAAKSNQADLQLAKNTYNNMRFLTDVGWNQVAMDAALLGLANQAKELVLKRAAVGPAPGYRFPVYAPHCYDYPPSADHYAVMTNAVTYMLMQTIDDVNQGVVLFPGWPCSWDVTFKIHAPMNTIIEGSLLDGKLLYLDVVPENRKKFVKIRNCQFL